MGGVVRARGVFQQDARFQARAALLADPGQFQFGAIIHSDSSLMVRGGKSSQAFDSLFAPIGTVEISPAIHRRVAVKLSAASRGDA